MIDYISSDHHFDHSNIIEYTDRPFESVEEMNTELLNNWNKTVDETDTVLYLGDLSLGTTGQQKEWLNRLNGEFIFITGNHDEITMNTENCVPVFKSLEFEYSGIQFYATHYPEDIPNMRWLLHGHVHNNDPQEHPFYDPRNNKLNLSVEVTDYKPVSMEEVVDFIRTKNNICQRFHR